MLTVDRVLFNIYSFKRCISRATVLNKMQLICFETIQGVEHAMKPTT